MEEAAQKWEAQHGAMDRHNISREALMGLSGKLFNEQILSQTQEAEIKTEINVDTKVQAAIDLSSGMVFKTS